MASGFGINGMRGRCYPLWLDFSECMTKCETPEDCRLLREDYLECLHHRKEFARMNVINKEAARKAREKKEGKSVEHGH